MQGIINDNALQKIDSWEADIFADYAGSDRKDGVISPTGKRYLIKYAETHTRKNDIDTSYVNNVLAEHLSSSILKIIGYPVHNTFLATRNGELVVGCENFTTDTVKLIEFGRFLRKHYDSGELGRVPDFKQIKNVLHNDPMLSPHEDELWQSYCERFVADAFTGNFDRHMGNFGYLVSREKKLEPAPVYDNGSTLFPALSEHGMCNEILNNNKEILKRTLLFPKAALTVNGQKVRYFDMLSSNYDLAMSIAVHKMIPVIKKKLPEIMSFIQAQPYLSDTRQQFYQTILQARFDFLLQPAYECSATRQYNQGAYERLASGINYTEEMFEREYHRLCKDADWQTKIQKISDMRKGLDGISILI